MHRIVVADDHPLVFQALRQALPSRRFRVVAECVDGPAALAAVRAHRPDLLVLDLALPGLGGIAVLQRLRAERLPVRVLVLSGEDDRIGGPRALRAGADGYVCKRRPASDLTHAIGTVARGKRCFAADVLALAGGQQDDDALLGGLSDREFEVLNGLARGASNPEIGLQLALAPKLVSACRNKLMRKLGLPNLRALIEFARTNRLIDG